MEDLEHLIDMRGLPSWAPATTATMNTSTKSTTLKSFTMKVRSLIPPPPSHPLSLLNNPLPDTKEEDLTHPEDIAHFAKHEREELEAERLEKLNQQAINEANIPAKFRRQP